MWTAELRDAVRRYLIHELPAAVRNQLVNTDTVDLAHSAADQPWVKALLALDLWEVALEVRNAAIAAVPTLRQLIGHLDTWPSGEEPDMTVVWLEAHSDTPEWRAIARAVRQDELLRITLPSKRTRGPLPDDLVRVLTPQQLLTAWEYAVGPAPTDLTDAEWQLLAPHFPQRRVAGRHHGGYRPLSKWELAKKRRALDGLRYKFLNDVGWGEVPSRYGGSLYQTWHIHCGQGLYITLRDGLKGNPDAAPLVEWLD